MSVGPSLSTLVAVHLHARTAHQPADAPSSSFFVSFTRNCFCLFLSGEPGGNSFVAAALQYLQVQSW